MIITNEHDQGRTNGKSNLDSSVDTNVGGQAVIEGVMMRSPKFIATAVRLPDGKIEVNKKPFESFITRHKFLNIPIIRGGINFVEMLIIGLDTLNWSADIQMKYEDTCDAIPAVNRSYRESASGAP